MNWNEFYLTLAIVVSHKSKDRSTKCGCVLVGPDREVRSLGFNGLPRGVFEYEERHERPEKYQWFEHAEPNAIFNAARCGTATRGCTAYVTAMPCSRCASALIQAGIVKVVVPCCNPLQARDDWDDARTKQMFAEAGVELQTCAYNKPELNFDDYCGDDPCGTPCAALDD